MKKQVGSGFTFNQNDVIGGQMARVGYSECDIPSYYNKPMVYDVGAPVQQSAGARRSVRKMKKSKKSERKSQRKRDSQKKGVRKSKSDKKTSRKVRKVSKRKSSSKRHM